MGCPMGCHMEMADLFWPEDRLGVAGRSLLSAIAPISEPVSAGTALGSGEETLLWLARRHGCDARRLEYAPGELARALPQQVPALLRAPGLGLLAVLSFRGNRYLCLAPDGSRRPVPANALVKALRNARTAALEAEFAGLRAHLPRSSRLAESLRTAQLEFVGWSLQPQSGSGLRSLLRASGAWQNASCLVAAHLAQYGIWLLAWYLLGRISLTGRFDYGWLVAWSLLLFTLVPIRVFETYASGLLVLGTGATLKKRLLAGALRLTPDEVRVRGMGGVLSQVFESSTLDYLALSGGVGGLLAFVEIAISLGILGPLAWILVACCLVTGLLAWRFGRAYHQWTETRMGITADLLENMIGHRTRLVQQPREHWHRDEDISLSAYWRESRHVDRVGAAIVGAMPRLWLTAALISLAPSFLSGQQTADQIGVRLGGILLAFTALGKLSYALTGIAATWVACSRVRFLFDAAGRPEMVGTMPPEAAAPAIDKILELERVSFAYGNSGKTVLQEANLTIHPGDRILLEGPSGGGKSTLVQLLTGLRKPSSGLVLAVGIDRHTRGEAGWRKQVAAAPQFQENYLLSETLAANLLLGRPWPPTREGTAEAEAICRELGLGPLLDRMPAGIMQVVGEGGWQLSHGERSRIFLARALLQKSPVTILDETLGTLDPETLEQALQCTLRRSNALLVVAHP